MRRFVLGVVVLFAVVVAQSASASQLISTSSVKGLKLGANAKGEAMLTYTVKGKVVHVLASGAINAIAPTPGRKQVAFDLSYDGGFKKNYTEAPTVRATLKNLRGLQKEIAKAVAAGNKTQRDILKAKIAADYATLAKLRTAAADYWKTFTCPKYDGPAFADEVTACKAPDGSYWAVQSWDRDLPDYGVEPSVAQSQLEVHLAHWTGPLPVLDVHVDWAYGGQWNHLWGTYTYDGTGVHGFASTHAGVPLDSFGRNLYVDTYGSDYGPGWQRENSFLMHGPGGSWCYSVNPHTVNGHSYPAGTGSQYRLTILGPGVTPDVSVTVAAPGPYDRAAQEPDNAALAALNDPKCVPH